LRLVLRLRHVRKVEGLASFRQRDPRIAQAGIVFALFGIVCFLSQSCASGGRFPCGLALRSHLVLPRFTASPPERPILRSPRILRGWCPSLFLADEKIAEPAGITLRRVPAHGERTMPRAGVFLVGNPTDGPRISYSERGIGGGDVGSGPCLILPPLLIGSTTGYVDTSFLSPSNQK